MGTKEHLLERIESTNIEWKEGKNISAKKVTKKIKNKKSGEIKTKEVLESVPSFFNFFTNLRFPLEEDIKNINFNTEKELGLHFTDEIIPYAMEFFLGVVEDKNEYPEYVAE